MPNLETVCLLCELLSDADITAMGFLSVLLLSDLLFDWEDKSFLLTVTLYSESESHGLGVYRCDENTVFPHNYGLAVGTYKMP
jgi:hypothetical protein